MGTFSASLKTPGDRRGLPATVRLEDGRLSIAAGEEPIGDWELGEIHLEQVPTGYRLSAEGEHILISLPDTSAFESELVKSTKRKRLKAPSTDTLLGPVDKGLAAAQKKWGPLLPEWVFTRIMFAIVFGALVLTVVLPGLVSNFLLIAGLLMVVFGTVVYTDAMLASKWLPGRTTPVHVLIFGVAVLMFGVLLGVIAR